MKLKKSTENSWESVFTFLQTNKILLGILLLAALLRFYKIRDFITFLGDEGRDAIIVYNMLHGDLPFIGPTASVGGFYLGPIYYYFMAPFLWLFNYDPVGPAIMVALFGIATVWVVYKVTSEFFNKTAGIVAALLYAISPLVVIYSRSSWNPNLMPFFTLLLFYFLYKAVVKNNSKLFLVAGVVYGILMQLHYIQLFVGLAVVLYVVLCSFLQYKFLEAIKNIIKNGIVLLIGFLAAMSLFIAFEIKHGFLNIKTIFSFITTSGDTGSSGNFFQTIIDVFSRVFGRLLVGLPSIQDIERYEPTLISVWQITSILLGLLLVGFLIWQLSRKKVNLYVGIALLVWLVVSMAMFGFYKRAIYDYYYAFLYPLPFLLFGNAFSFFWAKGFIQKILLTVLLVGMSLLLIRQLPLLQMPNKQVDQTVRIVDFVLEKAENKSFNFAIISGNNSDHAYTYFMKLKGRDPVEIQDYEKDPERKSVTDQLLVVCESLPCYPLKDWVWKIAFFGKAEIEGHWVVPPVEVYKLKHVQNDKFIKFSPSEE